jgi:SAM-dependent methyltransferase
MLKREQYSESFNHLISDRDRVTRLLNGCCFHSSSFQFWGHSRRFIASAIDKDGTILDIGCANGFLLRCFQEWSGHLLTPYGIDLDESFIDEAKLLFPQHKEHFLQFDILELPEASSFILPQSYDFIYWAIWDNWTFQRQIEIRVIRTIQAMVKSGGKLILGLYHEDRSRSFAVIAELERLGFSFSNVVENFDGCEVIALQVLS